VFTEEQLEQTTLAWFEALGYEIKYGPDIAFDGSRPERDAEANYSDAILANRLREALERINSDLPFEAIDEAIRKITRTESPNLIENNRRFHRFLTGGSGE
jgi:type I restriction enzyme R subunit